MREHPHALSVEDKDAISALRQETTGIESDHARVSRRLYNKVFDIIGRMPSWEPLTGPDGKHVEDDSGRLVYDYDKPTTSNIRYVLTEHDGEEHFMFRNVAVFPMDDNGR